MRFPSLIRLPGHQRFNFKPRHYDPVKEEIEQRVSKIKSTLENEKKSSYSVENSSISGAFRAQSTTKSNTSTSGLQLLIALFLMVTIFGWLYYGNTIFYSYFIAFPILVWYKTRHLLATISAGFSVFLLMGIYLFEWNFPYMKEAMITSLLMAAYFWFKHKFANR